MKKLLSAICPLFAAVLISNSAFADSYSINKYDLDLNFKKDNTINVSENINASFYRRLNGLSRTIGTQNLSFVNNKASREIHNVQTNNIHVISQDNDGNQTIKIIDTQKQQTAEKEYSYKYDLEYNGNIYTQDFRYDIIDGSWDGSIEKLNFKITLPFNLKKQRVEFISSTLGIINNDNLDYKVVNNTIEGHYNTELLPNEVLTLHITPNKKEWSSPKQNQLVLNNVKEEKITLYENDEVIIRLNSNPTTGFVWQMSVDNEDENIISISDEKYIPSRVNSEMTGSGGISEFRVKALQKGQTTITGVYLRPWMSKFEDASENRVEYTIEVK